MDESWSIAPTYSTSIDFVVKSMDYSHLLEIFVLTVEKRPWQKHGQDLKGLGQSSFKRVRWQAAVFNTERLTYLACLGARHRVFEMKTSIAVCYWKCSIIRDPRSSACFSRVPIRHESEMQLTSHTLGSGTTLQNEARNTNALQLDDQGPHSPKYHFEKKHHRSYYYSLGSLQTLAFSHFIVWQFITLKAWTTSGRYLGTNLG